MPAREWTSVEVDLEWLPDAHPAALTPAPQQDGGENAMEKLVG